MGLWAKLAGGAVGVAGLVTGNPALIAAGAGIIGTDVATEGAKKASEQQIASAEKAMAEGNQRYDATRAEQRAIYDQSASAFQPYIGLGHGVLPTLGSMVGLERIPTQFQNASPEPIPTRWSPDVLQQERLPMTQSPAQARAERMTTSAYGKREGLGFGRLGGMVLLQSPDGKERRLLPRDKADQAIALGATEIG